MARNKILIVDDEGEIRFAVRDFLESNGFTVREAHDCRTARQAFTTWNPDAVVLDFKLPDGDALDLLIFFKHVEPNVAVVILTGHGSIQLAVTAMQHGADQFLTKPIDLPALQLILERAVSAQRQRQKEGARTARQTKPEPFIGSSAAIRNQKEEVARIVAADSPVLIHGETGTGKGVLARWLHESGPRGDESFVDLNCAGLTREFLESEMFGHEKGAFTGAVTMKRGLLELAHRGTLFLDEIGDMDLAVQAKLLKVVEEKKFRRLGEVQDRQVDVRLIAASHHDLAQLVKERRFRADLYFRLNTLQITLPPLRERAEDIDPLAEMFIATISRSMGKDTPALSRAAREALGRYSWPGNIRELRNVIERALLFTDGGEIALETLRFEIMGQPPAAAEFSLDLTLADVERLHIVRMLEAEQWHVDRVAERLGVPRSSLYDRIKRLGLLKPSPDRP